MPLRPLDCDKMRGLHRRCANVFYSDENYSYLEIHKQNGEIVTAKFDTEYLDIFKMYHWQHMSAGYIRTTQAQGCESMHRMVLRLKGICLDGLMVDHIDGDPLNNTGSNLRTCTHRENCRNSRNRPIAKNNGVIGVRKDTRCINSWRAQIYLGNNKHIEKTFRSREDAVLQRLKWELEYFGEFAPQADLIMAHYPDLLCEEVVV